MIKIKIYQEKNILFTCKNMWLEPYAPTSLRKFIFQQISKTSRKRLLEKTSNDGLLLHASELWVLIIIRDKFNKWQTINDFKLYLRDYGNLDKASLWVSGLIFDDYHDEYNQGVTDIFKLWEKGEDIKWAELSLNSSFKGDYIYSCFLYSSLSNEIFERDQYKFDMSLINEDHDLLYYAGLEFIGDKGYFGNSLYTLKDCLLQVYHHGGFSKSRKISFSNVSKISSAEIQELYQEIKTMFQRFNFTIEEQL